MQGAQMTVIPGRIAERLSQALLHCAFLVFSTALSADTKSEPADLSSIQALQDEIRWLKEETYVTTATRTHEEITKSGSTITILSDQDLQKMGARNLMDALKRIPGLGVNINNMGHPVIEVRGVKTDFSEKVLFLLNGHAINNNSVNGGAMTSYMDFLIDDVKRVEIVRGPGSALYGANAFLAVINIITRTAQDLDGSQLSLSLGDNESRKLNIQSGQVFNTLNLAFNASLFDTEGYREHVASDVLQQSGQTNDWKKQLEFGFNLHHANYTFQGKYVNRNSGPYVGLGHALNERTEQEFIEYFLDFNYFESLSEALSFNQRFYFNSFWFDNIWQVFTEGFPTPAHTNGMLARSSIKAESLGSELQFEYDLHQHKVVFGLMAEHQTIFDVGFLANFNPSVVTADPLPDGYQDIESQWPWIGRNQRDIRAAYLHDIWDINKALRLILGARYDHYSDVGSSLSPRASIIWELSRDQTIVAAYGSAFRAPNFGELHNQNNPNILGNPALSPEEIDTYELSFRSKVNKRTSFQATAFLNEISDLIASRNGIASNVGELKVQGLELDFTSRLRDGSSIGINYTYQYGNNEQTGSRLREIPNHKANLNYFYRHTQYLGAFLGINHTGRIKRDANDPRSALTDFTTVDVALNLESRNHLIDITLSVYNLFNQRYADPAPYSPAGFVNSDFPKPGRNFMIAAKVNI
jgi:iron complex outermembrane receptor protein